MPRLLIGSLVLALAVVAVRADDATDKPKDKPSGDEAYKALMQETVKAFRAAESQDEKRKVLDQFSPKFVEFAKANPKSKAALQALMTVLSMPSSDTKDGPKAKALQILQQNYADSKELGPVLRRLGMSDEPGVIDFLKVVIEKNPEKQVQADALKAILGNREGALVKAEDAKAAAAIRAEIGGYRKLVEGKYKGMIKDLFVGAKMPELTSKDLKDNEVKLSDLKGKVVVLDLWATWCPPCRAMIPHERKLVERLKDKPFALVSVSFDEEKKTLTDFLEKEKMPWTHWFNGQDGPIGKTLDVQFFPTIYVLDGNGVIRYKNVRENQLDKAVDTLIKETNSKKGGASE
ncbi:MAG: TlpA disulfide reductase family protein [Gemmataceae bacterium]